MYTFQKNKIAKWAAGFALPAIFILSVVIAFAQEFKTPDFIPSKPLSYTQLMRQVNTAIKEGVSSPKQEDNAKNLDYFIKSESATLDDLGVNSKKQKAYLNLLRHQLKILNGEDAAPKTASTDALEVKMPQNPGKFKFSDDPIVIKSLNNVKIVPQQGQNISVVLKKIAAVEIAQAVQDQFLPLIEDVRADNKEVIIDSEIRDIASSLHNNPVEIVNFVRNTITYEPYYGAKKGSIGCLREKTCNDTDASSLTISLLRASGIPARYKKSAAIFTVDQLKNLLGVDETKTAFAALAINKVPVYVLTDILNGVNLDSADFLQETHLALEWTHVQAFYEYDEKGANIPNFLDLSAGTTTSSLQDILRSHYKKQWIPVDPIVKTYVHTKRDILTDAASFNTEQFWYGFFQYQGTSSPLAKYLKDVAVASGRQTADNLSTKTSPQKTFQILPATLPYVIGSASNPLIQIPIETFSVLPDARRQQVKISLKEASGGDLVLSKTFLGAEINNAKLNLYYDGLTATDKATIEHYGGIHATPAALVDIAPYFEMDTNRYENVEGASAGRPPVSIGNNLILQFEYFVNGQRVYNDEKFSVAGNNEGIFITLSQIQDDPQLDDQNDPNRNSHILLEGNTALAREFLKRVQEDGATLKKSLDHEYTLNFARAVVTQNRILNELSGIPTTFDFKGLSLDASAYIVDYSNRGNYKTHNKDFRLIWSQNASYLEGQIFKDVAGLDGISTVKGLQFAYANPTAYAVSRINSANEAQINQLQLSANTKANMHAEVAAGNTILTPDKFIEDGTWRGILYVSLRPDWTAQYAIGEQVGTNGGWTVDGFQIMLVLIDGQQVARFINQGSNDNFVFADKEGGAGNPMGNDMKCRISRADFLDISNNTGWDIQYGLPCMRETKKFGTGNLEHIYILATDGAKFYGVGWIREADVKNVFQSDRLNNNPNNLINVRFDGLFKFNTIAGTYSQFGHYDGPYEESIFNKCRECLTVYYEPNLAQNNRGYGRIVYGKILSKLEETHYDSQYYICATAVCGKYNWVINYLGYPTGNQAIAPENTNGTEGWYQSFIGGRIYTVYGFFGDETYYIPGRINNYFNENGSAAGKFGFPIKDPVFVQEDQFLLQNFENGRINLINEITEDGEFVQIITSQYIEENNQEYWEGAWDLLFENGIYGLVVNTTSGVAISKGISTVMTFLVKKYPAKLITKAGVKFIPAVGWAFLAYSVIMSSDQLVELTGACNSNVPVDDKNPSYYCGKRDTLLALVGVGFVGDQVARAYKAKSWLGVKSPVALQGKYKLYRYTDDEMYNGVTGVLARGDYKRTRTKFFEDVNNLQEADIRLLGKDRGTIERFLDIENFYLYNRTRLSNVKTANQVNSEIGSQYPPYKVGTNVAERITTAPINNEFIRFHKVETDPKGEWIVRKSEIERKFGTDRTKWDSIKIQDFLAMPEPPVYVSDVNIPVQIRIREGIAGSQPQWGTNGGALQSDIVGNSEASWFTNPQRL